MSFIYVSIEIPTRIWDTFAEPNNFNNDRVKLSAKIRPQPRLVGVLAQKAG
jgi:hypothetical protein